MGFSFLMTSQPLICNYQECLCSSDFFFPLNSMDNHDDNYNKTISLQGIPILRVISICAAAVLGTQSRGWLSHGAFDHWAELRPAAPPPSVTSLPRPPFCTCGTVTWSLGFLGKFMPPSSWPLFCIWNAMCVVRPVLCSWPLVSPLGLGLRTLFTEDTASGFIMAVFRNTVPRKCPQNQTLVLNLGLWVQECPPPKGNQTCHHVEVQTAWGGPLSAPGVLPCSIGSCLLRTWSTIVSCMGTSVVEHNPALNAQRLIKD